MRYARVSTGPWSKAMLRKRILLGYGVAFVLMAMVIVWAVINLITLGNAAEAILRENYRSILAAESMINSLERQDSAVLLIVLGYDEGGVAQFRRYEAEFLQWLARAKDNITIKGEAELLDAIDRNYSTYLSAFTSLRGLLRDQQTQAPSFYHESILPLFTKLREDADNLRTLNQNTMYDASRRAETLAAQTTWSTSVVGVSVLLVGLVFSLLLSDRIVRPLRLLTNATQAIAKGDYDAVPIEGTGELGLLAEKFNEMAEKLNEYHKMNIGRMMEEKWKSEAILRSIDDGLVVMDSRLLVMNINPAVRRMLGVEEVEEGQRHISEVIPDEKLVALLRQTTDSGRPPLIDAEEQFLVRRLGNETHYYSFGITCIHGQGGAPRWIVLLLRDITRLKEVDRLKSEFVMAASHELRTPLTGIGMSIDLLREHAVKNLDERDRELLQAAHEETQRLRSLVNDLLDLSRMEAGNIQMEFSPVSIKMMLEKVKSLFMNQAMEKEVELSVVVESEMEVKADANKMAWVLTNLLSNGLRYVPRGGHIRLSAQRAGDQIYISVSDDGPGIPPEYQTKIFQKFFQMKADQETGGSGLGLAIAKEIVRAHGGTIWVDSTPGQGSTFTFTLPAVG